METTIDAAGRLVIPKKVREEAGLKPGIALAVHCSDGRIVIEPKPADIEIVRRGNLQVAKPSGRPRALTEEVVEATRARLIAERANPSTSAEPGRRKR